MYIELIGLKSRGFTYFPSITHCFDLMKIPLVSNQTMFKHFRGFLGGTSVKLSLFKLMY